MADITALQAQIKVVALTRQRHQESVEAKKREIERWEKENAGLLDLFEITNQNKEEAEAKLRELTLQVYAETGNKKPCEGVGVREITKFQYDPKEAFQWGIKHSMALKLDVSAFEKICKADMPEFVEPYMELQATIATDLSEVLK